METELAEIRNLLKENGFGYTQGHGYLNVIQHGLPAALPTPLNNSIACLPYVLGVFDTLVPNQKTLV